MNRNLANFLQVFLLGTLIAILLTYPLILKINTLYSDQGDSSLIGWMLWHSSKAITNGTIFNQTAYFNANQFYPFPYSLAYSENLLLPAIIFTPIYLITQSLSLSVNFYSILTFSLTFLSSFYVFLYFFKNRYPSIIGAVIFTFNPVTFAHFNGHLHLESKFFLPLIFLFLYRFLISPNFKDAILLSLVFTLNALTGIHLEIFAVSIFPYFVLPFIGYALYKMDFRYLVKYLQFGWVIVLFLPIIFYVYTPYLEFSKKEGIVRGMFESSEFSAKPLDFISTVPNNFLYGKLVRNIEKIREPLKALNYSEHSLSLNVIPVILFIAGVFYLKAQKLSREKKMIVWGCLLMGIASLILSFGPVYEGWVLPYYYVNYYLHLFDGIRVPSRFQIIFYLPFALICAYGFISFSKFFTKNLAFLFWVVLFLLVIENFNIYTFEERSKYIPKAENSQLDYKQFDFLKLKQTLHLPTYVASPHLQNEYLNLSTISEEKLLNGYSGYFPADWVDLLANIEKDFDVRSLKILKAIGVEYIILHKQDLDKDFSAEFLKKDFVDKYKYFENDYFLILSLDNINITLCNLNKDIDFLLEPYQQSFGEKTTFFYRLNIRNKSDCYLPSILQNRYLEREFYFNGKTYIQNIRMPIILEPFGEIVKK